MKDKIAIQGYPGSFHDEVCRMHFGDAVEVIPANSFDILGKMLWRGEVHNAVMAIENSIAGTLLQNYRILRESGFWITGEKYLRIKHNLLVNHGVTLGDLSEVHSHPMALNQCLQFLSQYPQIKLVETKDTALSAMQLQENQRTDIACIASTKASELYQLQVLHEGIETNKTNYTRFFMLSRKREDVGIDANKVSLYIRIPDVKGQLLKVLKVIDEHDMNMSKLQSFPVLGKLREYFFHIDVEFDHLDAYQELKAELSEFTHEFTELGIYQRDHSILMLNDKI